MNTQQESVAMSVPLDAVGTGPLSLSDAAIARLRELHAAEDNPALKLRVFVSGGGCSGFQYGFAFEESAGDDDLEFSISGIAVLLDSMSLGYLAGASIDFVEDLEGARFVIENPNATSTCGCGNSFTV